MGGRQELPLRLLMGALRHIPTEATASKIYVKSQEVYWEKALNLDHIQSSSMGSRALTESNGPK